MIHIKSFVLKVEAEACFEGHGGTREITCIFIFFNKSVKLKYAVIFPHKVRVAYTSFEAANRPSFICVHSQYQQNVLLL